MSVELSIVVAVYNEVPRNLLTLLERLKTAVAPLSYEVVFVNDGSGAKTSQALRQIAAETDYVKLVILSRNFGQQAAISAGLMEASGAAVVNIDSDLQDPPELIPDMAKLWREGYDVVYAKRSTRRDRLAKRLSAHLFYRLLGSMSSVDIPWDTGDFRLLDRKVVDALNALPEKTRFLRGMIPWLGFKQTGIAIDRDAREFGESTYTLKKLLQLAMDGLLSFSSQPLYLIPMVGGICLALGVFLLLAWMIVLQGSTNHGDISFWQSLLIPLVVALSGLQILSTGFVAVYLSKVLDEVRARPTYIIAERIGLPYATGEGEQTIQEKKRREDASGNPGQHVR